MPRTKNRRQPRTRTATSGTGNPARSGPSPQRASAPVEEGLNLWTQYARNTGETVAEFLRRFGEEQQRSYETWSANLTEAARPKFRPPEPEAVRARLEGWNRQAEAIGTRVREAFERSLAPQRELFELWAKPFLPADATVAERTQEIQALVQKLWSGLTVDLSRRMMDALKPGEDYDEFVQAQDAATKQFAENFQKLTKVYFTSPAFVTAFGRTLDSSLELQKSLDHSEEFFRRITGLPTHREISELNQTVRDLSEQVSRLQSKRP
jgi:hypothetical protein